MQRHNGGALPRMNAKTYAIASLRTFEAYLAAWRAQRSENRLGCTSRHIQLWFKIGSDLPARDLGRRIAHARIRVQFVKGTVALHGVARPREGL